jgi:hypothetical protein
MIRLKSAEPRDNLATRHYARLAVLRRDLASMTRARLFTVRG